MKRVEIPITKSDKVTNDIDDLIKEAKLNLRYNPSFVSNITLEQLVSKLKQNITLSKEELIYAYDIYNTRWISDIYTKYDFNKGTWKNNVLKTTFYPSGEWRYYRGELSDIKYINDILDRTVINYLAYIFDCDTSEIATSETILRRNPEQYVILLDNLTEEGMYSNLKYIVGNVILPNATDIFLPSLEAITYHVDLSNLSFADGLKNLRSIGGNANFSSLLSPKGLSSLESIIGDAIFPKIDTTIGLNNLKVIGGDADFSKIPMANCLKSLKIIRGRANFHQLYYLDELKNISYIGELCETPHLTLTEKETLSSKTRKLVKE